MNYYCGYYRTPTKVQPVSMWKQFSHISRFKKSHSLAESDFVSPFLYCDAEKVNYTRIVAPLDRHEKIAQSRREVERVSELVKVQTFREWVDKNAPESIDENVHFHIVTPVIIKFIDINVHFKDCPSFYDLLTAVRDSSRHMMLYDGFPASSVFRNKCLYLMQHKTKGVYSSTTTVPGYARNSKTINADIGNLHLNLSDIYRANPDSRQVIGYLMYLMNMLVIGEMGLGMVFPYQADIEPIPELLDSLGRMYVGLQLNDYYPIIYQVK